MLINNIPFFVDVETIINELKFQLKQKHIELLKDIHNTSENIMITCPYHKDGQENKPSAGIKKSDGMFHCFTCGEVHTLQELISFCLGYKDDILGINGWNWLISNFLSVDIYDRKDIEINFDRNPLDKSKNNYISESELDTYRYYHSYMWKRKLTPEIVDFFDIGYDKNTESITFPVRDIKGNCLFVARRSVNTKYFNYPTGVEKPIYGLYELSLLKTFPDEIIICESMLDALTCWVYGKYAVALNGLGNQLQFLQLNKMECRKFIIGTDNDNAGQRAKKRIYYNLKSKLISEYIFPKNRKDINELSKDEFLALKENIYCVPVEINT